MKGSLELTWSTSIIDFGRAYIYSPSKIVTVKSNYVPNRSATDKLLLILAIVFNSTNDLLNKHALEHSLPPSSSGQSHLHAIGF